MSPTFALLHATYRRAHGPLEIRSAWLASADRPTQVEYVVAMDDDDPGSIEQTAACHRAIGPSLGGAVTAVRNWNAAAALAKADLLVVIADDLFPCPGWDSALAELTGSLDPRTTPFAIKVGDDPDKRDTLLRHPVVSRAFYEKYGLFGPDFRGVYCDDDLTLRAFWEAFIIDGRPVALDHRHPTLAGTDDVSVSQERINHHDEYHYGATLFESTWPIHRRCATVRLIPPQLTRAGLGAVLRRRRRLLLAARAEGKIRALIIVATRATIAPFTRR